MKRNRTRETPPRFPGVKRALCLLLSLFLVLPCLSAAAVESANNRSVRAGVFYFDGYHMQNDDGRYTGYGIEFLNMVSQYSHLNFSYVGYDKSWGDMLTMLDNGEIDMVTSARKNAEREEKYAFSLPIGRNSTVLSVQVNNSTLLSGNYDTYNNMLVGVLTGSSQNQSLAEFALEKGFSYRIREYTDSEEMADDLQNGAIDAILSSNLRGTQNERTLDTIETEYFYAVVRKEDQDLIDEINYAINQMNINEGDWSNILYFKYYGSVYSSGLTFTERELAYIRDVVSGKKQITVTSMNDRMPYSYAENGRLTGILPEYFAEIMNLAGLPYQTVVPADRAEYYDLLDRSAVDVVVDWRLSQPAANEYSNSGFYTDAYMSTGIALVTRKDFSGTISTLAVPDIQGDFAIEEDLIGDAQVLNCPSREIALKAVLTGKADATYVYTYSAQCFVNNDASQSLQYSIVNSPRFDFKMYVRNSSDHELITILNKCIQHAPEDALSHLITNYTSNSPETTTLLQYVRAHPEVLIVVTLLAIAAISTIILLFLRTHWSKKLLDTTEHANRELGKQLAIVNTLSRDYVTVYAVDAGTAMVRPVKIADYATPGPEQDSPEEAPYDEILADYIHYCVLPEDRQYLSEALTLDTVVEKLKTGTEYSGSYRVLSDGEVHTYQFTCSAHSASGENDWNQDNFFLVGFRNIDEIVRREREQKQVLETALAEAQRANVAKTTFLNNMSHDIRTPMNAIIGFASLGESHIENRKQVQSYLDKILISSKHLLRLINDILDMSRIESGKVKIEEDAASLPDIMHDLKTIVQTDVKSKQLLFRIDSLDVTHELIICDRLRLNQVLLNVLSNAIKYTNPGGMVSIRIVQTSSEPEGFATYEFRVKDSGIGMSETFLTHIFEPFERERTATVSGIQGTGLGLAITKNIVDMMNGSISVTSEKDKGSEFVVSFRFRTQDDPEESAHTGKLAGLRALVADDDPHTGVSVSRMLTSMGIRPEWTDQGKEAITMAESALAEGDPFKVFLIAWQLPDLNGIEAARQLREIAGEDAAILILTAYDWTGVEDEAKDAGITAFFSKPLFRSELREILTAPFREQESAAAEEDDGQMFVGKRILLVEDNELNQEIARTVLEEAGLTVDTADDGTEAVEAMEKAPAGTYDLILMDVQMPLMDGYTASRTIRSMEDPGKAGIPILAMTANAFEEDRQKAMDAGMDGHVPKPIDIPKLLETLASFLFGEH